MQGAGGTRTLSHYGPGRDWVRRCVAVCGRPIIGQSARSAKHSEKRARDKARAARWALDNALLSLNPKEVFWYELPRTPRSLIVGVWRLYLPNGVMNQVSATKNRGVKA